MHAESETTRSDRAGFRSRVAAGLCLVGLGALVLLGGLACAEPLDEPNRDSLKASFVAQIEADRHVQDLRVYGDEIHFARRDGSGEHVDWRVRIDSLSVEPWAGDEAELAGRVMSSWSVAGRPVTVEVGLEGLVTDMPIWVLDAGLAPECWAFWDEEAKSWGW